MKQNEFPPGWDQGRVQAVIHHYDRQTEDQAVAEYQAAVARQDDAKRPSPSGDDAGYGPHDHAVSVVAEPSAEYDKDGK